MGTSFAKNFPKITSQPVDPATGQWNPEWYAFMIKLFQSTGGSIGTDPTDSEFATIQSFGRASDSSGEDNLPAREKSAPPAADYVSKRPPSYQSELAAITDALATIKRNRVPQLKVTSVSWAVLTLIQVWGGSVASIPAGFQLCDGTNGSPDLRGLFVIGAGGAYAVAATGGSTTIVANNLPAHTHNYDRATETDTTLLYTVGAASQSVVTALVETPTASAANATTATPYLQPYYALAYIINTTAYTVVSNVTLQE